MTRTIRKRRQRPSRRPGQRQPDPMLRLPPRRRPRRRRSSRSTELNSCREQSSITLFSCCLNAIISSPRQPHGSPPARPPFLVVKSTACSRAPCAFCCASRACSRHQRVVAIFGVDTFIASSAFDSHRAVFAKTGRRFVFLGDFCNRRLNVGRRSNQSHGRRD